MRKLSIASIIGLAMLTLPLGLWAQDDERAPLADIWLVMPKQGMGLPFEDAVRTHMAFRADAGETRTWQTYGVALGSNPMLYQFRASGMTWAEQDAWIAEEQEKGLEANWFANVDQYVDHYHHFIEEMDWENSHWPDGLDDYTYFGVTAWTVKQGAGRASEAARKELSRIAMEEGWASEDNNWLWHTRVGGKPTQLIVSAYENFADMAPPEQGFFEFVAEHLGSEEEAGKIFADFSSGFTDSTYTVWAHRPDLSTSEMAGADDD